MSLIRTKLSTAAFDKAAAGRYAANLRPGRYFNRSRQTPIESVAAESPLAEALQSLGLSPWAIDKFLQRYSHRLLREWLDITLAAKERHGPKFFKRSAAAYFVDNVRAAASGNRTPPDWWHEMRKAEERAQAERDRQRGSPESADVTPPNPGDLDAESKPAFDQIRDEFFGHLLAAGQSRQDARCNAERLTRDHFQRKRKHKCSSHGMTRRKFVL
jgi:hypothetical protein